MEKYTERATADFESGQNVPKKEPIGKLQKKGRSQGKIGGGGGLHPKTAQVAEKKGTGPEKSRVLPAC